MAGQIHERHEAIVGHQGLKYLVIRTIQKVHQRYPD